MSKEIVIVLGASSNTPNVNGVIYPSHVSLRCIEDFNSRPVSERTIRLPDSIPTAEFQRRTYPKVDVSKVVNMADVFIPRFIDNKIVSWGLVNPGVTHE